MTPYMNTRKRRENKSVTGCHAFIHNPSCLIKYEPTSSFSSFAAFFITSNATCGIRHYSTALPTFFRPALGRLPPHVLLLFIIFTLLSTMAFVHSARNAYVTARSLFHQWLVCYDSSRRTFLHHFWCITLHSQCIVYC